MMHGKGQRGHWSRDEQSAPDILKQTAAKNKEGPDKYDEYLIHLQRKNRVLKKLKAKDEDQIELERREQGFSLYVNGANEKLTALSNMQYSPRKPTTAKPKTAGDGPRRHIIGQMRDFKNEDDGNRARTAPGKVQRRNWQQASVDIKTNKGSKVKLKSKFVPDYSEDFEPYDSIEAETSQCWQEKEEDSGSDEDGASEKEDEDLDDMKKNLTMILEGSDDDQSDLEVDAKEFNQDCLDEDEIIGKGKVPEQLLLSMEDVKNLRRSLEANADIRQSIGRKGTERDGETSSEDDIEEEIYERGEILEKNKSESESGDIVPGDMIVLDFAFNPNAGRRKGHHLAARRKPDAEEVSLRRSPKSPSEVIVSMNSDIVMSATPTPRSSRPLSSQQKRVEKQWGQKEDLSEIQRAMEAENQAITARSETKSKGRKPETADKDDIHKSHQTSQRDGQAVRDLPLQSEPGSSLEPFTSDLMTSQNLDQYKMELVVDKVKLMDAKSQKKLLRELERLEESTTPKTSPKKSARTPNPDEMALFNTPRLAPRAMSATTPKPTQMFTTEVIMEISSNWGHPSRVGLTEVEFFNGRGEKMTLTPTDVWVKGSKDMQGMLGNIVNGRSKTTREKNMWSCAFGSETEVTLHFKVKQPVAGDGNCQTISRMNIWNYNKSLKDLSMGAKKVKILSEGVLIWDGVLEKGCGNQVFDYSVSVEFPGKKSEDDCSSTDRGRGCTPPVKTESGRSTLPEEVESAPEKDDTDPITMMVRSKTHILDKSVSKSEQSGKDDALGDFVPQEDVEFFLPKKSVSLPVKRAERESLADDHQNSISINFSDSAKKKSSLRDEDDHPKMERCKTRLLKKSSENLDIPTVDDSIQIFASNRTSIESVRGQNQSVEDKQETIPTRISSQGSESFVGSSVIDTSQEVLPSKNLSSNETQQQLVKQEKDTSSAHHLEAEDFNPEEMSMLQQLQNLSVKSKKKETQKPSWLKTEKVEPPEDDEPLFGMDTFPPKTSTGAIKEGAAIADDLEDERWRQQSLAINESQDGPCRFSGPVRRSKWSKQQQLSLEESWSSLSMFNKSQKGRLTANMEVEGDILDSYLTGNQTQEDPDTNDDSSDEFEIPVLPFGQQMKIVIKSTWGDKHYVGLNGIEVFQSNGELASIAEISADPPDINVLDEYDADPRVVTNLIDGINRTRDDIHMWLAPFISGRNFLKLVFEHPLKIAMIRIWNYNKSRIHSFRGAKDIEVFLEDRCIFKGEIDRASGTREGDMEAFGDTILFTEDEEILDLISRHDETYIVQVEDWFSSSMEDDTILERPKTADEGEERPFTTARKFRKKKSEGRVTPKSLTEASDHQMVQVQGNLYPEPEEKYIPSVLDTVLPAADTVLSGRYLMLNFTSTWGDYYYLGLTGLEVMDPEGDPIPITLDQLEAHPRDLNILPEYGSDDRTIDKILDGNNVTTSDEHMWLVPFTEGEDHTLTIDLKQKVKMSGLRIWNYNKSPEDTYRGAKMMHVFLDNRQISPKNGFLIRKGPGNCFFDFAQEISFGGWRRKEPSVNQALPRAIQESLRSSIVASEEPSQEYISMHMPCGFVFQFQLLCTWGDQYYVGLNGMEFYDERGNKIALTETNVAAYPPSINVLDGVEDDVRTPDKLIDGVNDSKDGRHMWLAPILPGIINKVYIIFDEPVTVSMIKLWNYSKTPLRGVKEFGLYLDDLLIYNGILGQVSTGARGILPTLDIPALYHTILFTDDVELLRKEKHTIIQNRSQDQDVQMTNEREVVEKHNMKKGATKAVDQALRPKTSIIHEMPVGMRR